MSIYTWTIYLKGKYVRYRYGQRANIRGISNTLFPSCFNSGRYININIHYWRNGFGDIMNIYTIMAYLLIKVTAVIMGYLTYGLWCALFVAIFDLFVIISILYCYHYEYYSEYNLKVVDTMRNKQ